MPQTDKNDRKALIERNTRLHEEVAKEVATLIAQIEKDQNRTLSAQEQLEIIDKMRVKVRRKFYKEEGREHRLVDLYQVLGDEEIVIEHYREIGEEFRLVELYRQLGGEERLKELYNAMGVQYPSVHE